VREQENHDVGFDAISLRWKIAELLDIPPILFGLTARVDTVQLRKEIKKYRQLRVKGDPLRTQINVATALGITEKAVRDMENLGKELDSLARRRVLASLLDCVREILWHAWPEEIQQRFVLH